jgi:putative SOS response-associated peptidase YedK
MCGRYTLTTPDYDTLARALGVVVDPELAALYRPRYNVAPTTVCLVVRERDGGREIVRARWGLVNSWAKDRSAGPKQINARSETAPDKPAFRAAFAKRRCVVPADGFYEWQGAKGARQPIRYHAPDGGLLAFAGLYESWDDPSTGERERTFTILTTAANELVAPVHDRMPAVLAPGDVPAWLAADTDAARARALLGPAPAGVLVATPASPRVNAVGNDDPGCLAPPEPPRGVTLSLFDRR